MKKRPPYLIQLICIFCAAAFLLGIAGAQQPDESDKDLSYWTVSGYRHGPSFFPLSRYNEIKPLKEGEWDFKHYHTYDEMIWWMKKWADEYPDLVDLYVAAKSFSGRDIYQLTLTNKKTGKHTDKPAMFVDGNRHAGEVTAASMRTASEASTCTAIMRKTGAPWSKPPVAGTRRGEQAPIPCPSPKHDRLSFFSWNIPTFPS